MGKIVNGAVKKVTGEGSVWTAYVGLHVGELLAALCSVEVSGYFAGAVDNCGVVAVA